MKENWYKEENIKDGLLKVLPVDNYFGIFQDEQGKCYDLRDPQKLVTFKSLKNKSVNELSNLLYTAVKQQIRALRQSREHYENNLEYALRKLLKKMQENYSEFLNLGK